MIQPGSYHRNAGGDATQAAAMCRSIHAERHAANDAKPGIACSFGKSFCIGKTLRWRITAADNGERAGIQQLASSFEIEKRGRIRNVEQQEG